MVSLGCPKNQVDAEQMLGVLAGSGYEITSEQTEADVIVVNTCGFIESAKEESIEAILEAARMKKQGKCSEGHRCGLSCPAVPGGTAAKSCPRPTR